MRVEDKLAVGCVVDGLLLEDKSVRWRINWRWDVSWMLGRIF